MIQGALRLGSNRGGGWLTPGGRVGHFGCRGAHLRQSKAHEGLFGSMLARVRHGDPVCLRVRPGDQERGAECWR